MSNPLLQYYRNIRKAILRHLYGVYHDIFETYTVYVSCEKDPSVRIVKLNTHKEYTQ